MPKSKDCTKCGKKYTKKAWHMLPLVGYGDALEDNDNRLEYRNCDRPGCGSTIAVVIPGTHAGITERDYTFTKRTGNKFVDYRLGWSK